MQLTHCRLVLSLVGGLALCAGCSAKTPPPSGTPDAATDEDGGAPPPPADGGMARPPLPMTNNCHGDSAKMFLLGFDLEGPRLETFDPPTLAFEERGPLVGCPEGSGFDGNNPWAAAMDRDGKILAHYLHWDHDLETYSYNAVYTIDTGTGACADRGAPLVHPGGKNFEYGMAFVRDPSDPDHDNLYATALDYPYFTMNAELDRVDLATLTPMTVAPLVDTLHSYLTSAGDGRLFTMYQPEGGGFGIRELDPATGASRSDQPITGLWNSSGPFVFWGGAVYVFWYRQYDPDALLTEVYRVSLSTYTAEMITSVPWIVTASAASTCAPVDLI